MSDKVKVCHVSSAHPRYDTRILLKECVSLQENGYEVHLVINDNESNEIYKGVKIHSTRKKYNSRIKRMCLGVFNVYKLARKIDADIYHLHDPELLLIALFLKKQNKKIIFDSHEAYYLQIKEKYYLPKNLRWIIAKVYRQFEKFIVKRIDAVIIPGTIEGKNIFKGIAKRVVLIDNLPRIEKVSSEQSEKKDDRGICYVGSLSRERGITNLVKASYRANAILYLAGKFATEEYKKELEQLKEYKNVRYLGYLNKNEVYKLYSEVKIGMCTLLDIGQYNKGDNLPTKVYEYMMGGLPVILSDFPYNRKMVRKYKFGLVADQNVIDDIERKINILFSNDEKRKEMAKNGRDLVLKKLNWNKEEKKLLSLYKVLALGFRGTL